MNSTNLAFSLYLKNLLINKIYYTIMFIYTIKFHKSLFRDHHIRQPSLYDTYQTYSMIRCRVTLIP